MPIEKVIFEHGLGFFQNTNKYWEIDQISKGQNKSFKSLINITEVFHLQPLIAIVNLGNSEKQEWVLDASTKKALDLQINELLPVEKMTSGMKFLKFSNLQYVLGAMLYHLKNLGKIYVKICSTFARWNNLIEEDSKSFIYQSNLVEDAYYEVDAFVSDIVRYYESLRYILWEKNSDNRSVPRSYESLLKQSQYFLPAEIAKSLNENWESFGKIAKEYRDCIHHYSPVIFGMPSARLIIIDNEIPSATILLPDNPNARSRNAFSFEKSVDGLTYCWKLANESVLLALNISEQTGK